MGQLATMLGADATGTSLGVPSCLLDDLSGIDGVGALTAFRLTAHAMGRIARHR